MSDESAPEGFEGLLTFLLHSRGFDFSGYKRSSLIRRVTKRMHEVGVPDVAGYIDHLELHPDEFTHLFNSVLINVTSFFRDPAEWEHLAQVVIPPLLANKNPSDPIRVWSAGCASGEEPYTLAIVLCEAMGLEDFRRRVKIYATDVDEEALSQARQATYSQRDIEPVPPALREKYFTAAGGSHSFRLDLRRSIIIGRHDLVHDAPISRLDLLVCRNTLMYFIAETQQRILSRIHFALNEHGVLFLGRAEMLLTHLDLFTPIDVKHRVFAKVSSPIGREVATPPNVGAGTGKLVRREPRTLEVAFANSSGAQIVVNQRGALVFINDRAREIFGLSVNDIGRPFQDLEISYQPVELRSLIAQAVAQHRTVSISEVERHRPSGDVQHFAVDVMVLEDEGQMLGTAIVFTDISRAIKLSQDLARVHGELETAYEELQSTNEELETTNEELQSTVEELETTNEELQASNEELETMNEELQSSNEELQTLNDELRLRTDDLNQVNVFLEGILANLRVPAIMVDNNLRVQLWNHSAEELWGLRATEVSNLSLLNLDIGLPVHRVSELVQACLRGDGAAPETVLDAVNRGGKPIRCRITCTPRLRADGQAQGAILLMEEMEAG